MYYNFIIYKALSSILNICIYRESDFIDIKYEIISLVPQMRKIGCREPGRVWWFGQGPLAQQPQASAEYIHCRLMLYRGYIHCSLMLHRGSNEAKVEECGSASVGQQHTHRLHPCLWVSGREWSVLLAMWRHRSGI